MKRLLRMSGKAAVYLGLIAALAVSSAQGAEKKTISGSMQSKRLLSRTIFQPGDDANHAMTQGVREEIITSSDPEWNEIPAMVYEQSDQVAGNGSHRGYLVARHKNGDESYLKFEGTHKTAITEGGAWEATSEGTIRITGGTGKFKDIRGSGTYKGTSTPKESATRWEATIE